MTNPPSNAPTRARRPIPLFLVCALAMFALMLLVASGTAFVTTVYVWLAAGLIALCLHWWFNVEL